jgi:hypothetical protein
MTNFANFAPDQPCRPPRTFGPVHAPVVAEGRQAEEPCEAGTVGCCMNHTASPAGTACETW